MSCFSEVFQHSSDWRWRPLVLSWKIAERFLFPLFLLQTIYGVISLALCPHILLQAPQHFRSTEITCEGCFACQSICSVIFLHFGMSRVVHTEEASRWMSTTDTCQPGLPVPLFNFCSKLIECERRMACVVKRST